MKEREREIEREREMMAEEELFVVVVNVMVLQKKVMSVT
jgi:hypothetical protein